MNTLDESAAKRINELEGKLQKRDADIAYYRSVNDLLLESLQEREYELRAVKGHLALSRQDHRYTV
jgi:hypothetical protein